MKSDLLQSYQDPRWQKLRLEVFERDNYACQHCSNAKIILHAHHKLYHRGKLAYEYELKELITLCSLCHTRAHDIQDRELYKVSQFVKYVFHDPIELELLIQSLRNATALNKEQEYFDSFKSVITQFTNQNHLVNG